MERTILEDSPQLNKDTMENLKGLIPIYHAEEDVLFIRSSNPRPSVSYDWEGELWIRFDPHTKEVVGIEIENFESVFIKKHPEVTKIWKEVKPFCKDKKDRVEIDDICVSFIRILLSFFNDLFKDTSQQASFGTA